MSVGLRGAIRVSRSGSCRNCVPMRSALRAWKLTTSDCRFCVHPEQRGNQDCKNPLKQPMSTVGTPSRLAQRNARATAAGRELSQRRCVVPPGTSSTKSLPSDHDTTGNRMLFLVPRIRQAPVLTPHKLRLGGTDQAASKMVRQRFRS